MLAVIVVMNAVSNVSLISKIQKYLTVLSTGECKSYSATHIYFTLIEPFSDPDGLWMGTLSYLKRTFHLKDLIISIR